MDVLAAFLIMGGLTISIVSGFVWIIEAVVSGAITLGKLVLIGLVMALIGYYIYNLEGGTK